ncbi:hypothetical protein PHLH4_30400 [Pseudomonas sp. St316]|nr:hypothetical protein PHLH4_30400 [Pseudomonas sp. St316]
MVDEAIFVEENIDKKRKKRVKAIAYLDIKPRPNFHFIA